jgi:hypothetical protein
VLAKVGPETVAEGPDHRQFPVAVELTTQIFKLAQDERSGVHRSDPGPRLSRRVRRRWKELRMGGVYKISNRRDTRSTRAAVT